MSIKPLIILPDPVLRLVSKPLERIDSAVLKLADDMLETMYDAPGIGLAAIQVGEPVRMTVIDLAKEDEEKAVEVDGEISAVLAGTMFRVKLASGHEVLAHISGKMRKRFIRLVVGDKVKMEMSPYDISKARIVYRLG